MVDAMVPGDPPIVSGRRAAPVRSPLDYVEIDIAVDSRLRCRCGPHDRLHRAQSPRRRRLRERSAFELERPGVVIGVSDVNGGRRDGGRRDGRTRPERQWIPRPDGLGNGDARSLSGP